MRLFIYLINFLFLFFCFSSEASGNCLYSAVSISMVGSNILIDKLRLLTSLELFLNCEYYYNHPCLQAAFNENKELFPSYNSLFNICISDVAFRQGNLSVQSVRKEAFYNCCDKVWASFLCVMALSTVTKKLLRVHYPDFGDRKYSVAFNRLISPRVGVGVSEFNILFCSTQKIPTHVPFTPNHFVALTQKRNKRSKQVKSSVPVKKILTLTEPQPKVSSPCSVFLSNKSTNSNIISRQFIHNYFSKVPSISVTATSTVSITSSSSFSPSTTNFSSFSTAATMSKSISAGTTPKTTTVLTNSSIIFPFRSTQNLPPSSENITSVNAVSSTSMSLQSLNTSASCITSSTSTSFSDSKCVTQKILPQQKYDIANYHARAPLLTQSELFDLIEKVYVPCDNFSFPKLPKGRAFRSHWLVKFPWLKYSPSANGGFCLPCCLFSHKTKSKSQGLLISRPVLPSADSTGQFNRHCSGNGLHSFCQNLFQTFLDTFHGKTVPIDVMVDSMRVKKIKENQSVLLPIIDAIIFCGRQGVALRGHRDDSSYYPPPGEYSTGGNVGNFIELINFGIRRGDESLKCHYEKHFKNASYLSKSTQNDIIKCCGEVISDDIVSEIKKNKFFSILADEAMDAAKKEQLALVLRYVDSDCIPREEFLRFVHLKEGLSGQHLANAILSSLNDLGLDISDCRGQGYDGAGSVSGHKNGCSAIIKRINSKALYTHCFSHRLNLSIAYACSLRSVSNMLGTVKTISYFFNLSEQRQRSFEKNIDIYVPETKRRRLKDVCRTRWVERILGLDVFEDLLIPIKVTLEEMKLDIHSSFNKETSARASQLFSSLDFDFIVNLVITRNVFDLTHSVTLLLQSRNNDIADGVGLIEAVIRRVHELRKNINESHEKWYNQALQLSSQLNISEVKRRVTKVQINRENHPGDTVSSYYLQSVTIQVVDYLLNDLVSRFSDEALVTYTGLYLVPSKMISSLSSWKEKVAPFFKFFHEDFPYPKALDAELDLWQEFWASSKDSCPNNVSSALKAVPYPGFENIKVALRILATLPITSCECERSFSGIRRLKNYTRTTMSEDRLNGLALMNVNSERVKEKD